MKGFIVLLCSITATLAAPQYNYAAPSQGGLGSFGGGFGSGNIGGGSIGGGHFGGGNIGGGNIGGGGIGGGHFGGGNIGGGSIGGGNIGGGHIGGGHIGGGHFGGGSLGGGNFGGGSLGGGNFGAGNIGGGSSGGLISGSFGGFGGNVGGGASHGGISGGQASHQTIVTKQFFIHSAPEEQDESGGDKVVNLGPGRKHYRVVFIKAPHQSIQGGKVKFVAPANEEKTVIYVLSKKTELSDIAADVQQAQSEPSKPDVFFIKYKTPEEAAHAQRQIQAQYDQLGGTSQVSDEGVAPVQSVIGALGQTGSAGGVSGGHISQGSGFSSGGGISGIGGSFGSTGAGISHSSSGSIHGGSIGGGSTGGATYLPPRH